MAEISDLINFAIDKNPVDFADTFGQLVQDRATQALDARKVEMASALYTNIEFDDSIDEDDL